MTLYSPVPVVAIDDLVTGTDVDYVINSVTVTHGRNDTITQPSPATATVSLLQREPATQPADLFRLGTRMMVGLDFGGGIRQTLIVGRITDLQVNENLLEMVIVSVGLGTATQAFPSSCAVGSGTSTAAFNTAAGQAQGENGLPGYSVISTSPVSVAATTFTGQNFLSIFQSIAAGDPSGVIQEDPRGFGDVIYAAGNSRRTAPKPANALTVPPECIITDWSASKSTGDKVNRCRVTYPTGSETYEDTADILDFGLAERSVETILLSATDAQLLARRTVIFGTDPGWKLSTLTVDARAWDSGTAAFDWFDTGRVGTLLRLPTPPSNLFPEYVFVEGWTVRATARTVFVDFVVSDPTLTRPPQRWDDIAASANPTRQWGQVPAGFTWNDALKEYL